MYIRVYIYIYTYVYIYIIYISYIYILGQHYPSSNRLAPKTATATANSVQSTQSSSSLTIVRRGTPGSRAWERAVDGAGWGHGMYMEVSEVIGVAPNHPC